VSQEFVPWRPSHTPAPSASECTNSCEFATKTVRQSAAAQAHFADSSGGQAIVQPDQTILLTLQSERVRSGSAMGVVTDLTTASPRIYVSGCEESHCETVHCPKLPEASDTPPASKLWTKGLGFIALNAKYTEPRPAKRPRC